MISPTDQWSRTLELWIAFVEALTVTEWVFFFLVTKPAFIFSAVAGVWWTRRGNDDVKALPSEDSPSGLLEADDLPGVP